LKLEHFAKTAIIVAVPIYAEKSCFFEKVDHGRSPKKELENKAFCENGDHGCSLIKTQKHVLIIRTAIMFTVL